MRLSASIRTLVWLGVVLPTIAFIACSGKRDTVNANTMTISGTVTYRPRIALPPDAVVRVRLEHSDRPDAAAAPLIEQMITTDGRQVPFAFELLVADSLLSPTGRYALRAEIRGDGGALLWTNSASYELPQPAVSQQDVELVVVQNELGDDSQLPAGVTGSAAPEIPTANSAAGPLMGAEWHLVRMQPPGGANVTPAADEAYTISFDEKGRYDGQAHCNRYGGDYRVPAAGTLALLQGISTLAACAPPSSSDVFMSILNAVTSFTRASDTLHLKSPAQGSLVFSRHE